VVALVLAVSPSFALAPVISCLPDITITDLDQGSMSEDLFFRFTDALDVDSYVTDADTSKSALRWSFVETTGSDIQINGLGSDTSGDPNNPANDIRAGRPDGLISLVNTAGWSAGVDTIATLEIFASDGTNYDQATIQVRTVDEDIATGLGDRLEPVVQKSWDFASSGMNWVWFSAAPLLEEPAQNWDSASQALRMAKTAAQAIPVFGSWESPKEPATNIRARFGCIIRATFSLRGTVDSSLSPSVRMRAIWAKVQNIPGFGWTTDFLDPDIQPIHSVLYNTFGAGLHVDGREPGTAGQQYEMLYYPVQTQTLMTTNHCVYISADVLDADSTESDAGEIFIESAVVDGLTNPPVGSGQAEAGFTFGPTRATDLSGFVGLVSSIADPSDPSQVANLPSAPVASAGSLSITVGPTNAYFEAPISNVVDDTNRMTPGRYYRAIYMVSATGVGTNQVAPTVRCGMISQRLAWSSDYELQGHGLLAKFDATPKAFETWHVAPTEVTGTGLTEPMQMRFYSWLTTNPALPHNKNIAGTIQVTDIETESFVLP
jgi:hypothetical protein